MSYQGKTVVISGGTSGIGRATALLLLAKGARVIVIGREEKSAQDFTALAQSKGFSNFKAYNLDVASLDECKNVFQKIGPIDILVNNAGYTYYKAFSEYSLEEVDHIIRTNYLGTVYLSKLFLDEMVRTKTKGHVVNVSSVAGHLPITPSSIYCASKTAVSKLTQLLSVEYEFFGITFTDFVPGRVATAFFDHPSFAKQHFRPENKGILSSETVAESLVAAIENKSRQVVIPSRFRLIIFLVNAVPWIFMNGLRLLLRKRMSDHFNQKNLAMP